MALSRIETYLTVNNVSMCDFAFEVDGVLKDQASYYVRSYDEILKLVSKKGNVIMEALT